MIKYSNTTLTSSSSCSVLLLCPNLLSCLALYIVGIRREGSIMTAEIVYYLKRILFRLRWLIMSDRERYAYLWNQTRGNL